MGIIPKSYNQMMAEMMGSAIATTKLEDLHVGSAMKTLPEGLEESMFGNALHPHERGLVKTLKKLKIKSAGDVNRGLYFGAPLHMESLEATLSLVTFDDTKIKLHKQLSSK